MSDPNDHSTDEGDSEEEKDGRDEERGKLKVEGMKKERKKERNVRQRNWFCNHFSRRSRRKRMWMKRL